MKIKVAFKCGNRTIGYQAFEAAQLPPAGTAVTIQGREYRTIGVCEISGDTGHVETELLAPTLEDRANMVREEFRVGRRQRSAEEIAADRALAEATKREFGL